MKETSRINRGAFGLNGTVGGRDGKKIKNQECKNKKCGVERFDLFDKLRACLPQRPKAATTQKILVASRWDSVTIFDSIPYF
jgi:hypothetical protein